MLYFYLPVRRFIIEWPDDFWKTLLMLLGGRTGFHDGPYSHTLHPYIHFRGIGLRCSLVDSWPNDSGVVIAHSDFLSATHVPRPDQTIVEIKPDRFLRCPFANFHVVQNRQDPIFQWQNRYSLHPLFVDYWPQPGLLPRGRLRGDRFENVYFFGNKSEMHPDLLAFGPILQQKKLSFHIVTDRSLWHDYTEVDAVVGIRSNVVYDYPTKPASKLSNAWLAGVPAVLGPESAYRDTGVNGIDYLEASTVDEIAKQIHLLERDVLLRRRIVHAGSARSSLFDSKAIAARWSDLMFNTVLQYHDKWVQDPLLRAEFFARREDLHRLLDTKRKNAV